MLKYILEIRIFCMICAFIICIMLWKVSMVFSFIVLLCYSITEILTITVFSSAVELCICAHECFTATCDMDGISQILHRSQHLVTYLEEAKKFSIIVMYFLLSWKHFFNATFNAVMKQLYFNTSYPPIMFLWSVPSPFYPL